MALPRSLKKYLLTYSVALLLPLGILTYFCYSYLIGQFEKMVYESQQAAYQSEAVEIEHRIGQMRDVALQLSNSPDVLIYHLSTDIDSQVRIIQMLGYAMAVSDSMEDLLLLDLSGNVYTATGSYNLESYSNLYRLPLERIQEDIRTDLLSDYGLMPVYPEEGEDAFCYFVCSYPYGAAYSGGALIFRVDRAAFLGSLKLPCLVFYDDQLMTTQDDGERVAAWLDSQDDNLFNLHLESGRVRVLAYLDEKTMFEDFYQVRSRFMVLELILAVISLGMIVFFSYRSYQPLKQLSMVMVKLGLGEGGQGEIDASIASMKQLSLEKQQVDDRLLSETYVVREMWLSRLVNRQYRDGDSILKNLRQYGVFLPEGCYTVCIFRCGQPLPRSLYPQAEDDAAVRCWFFHDADDRVAAILAGESLVRILVERTVTDLMEQFALQDLEMECFVGGICRSVEDINLSYIQALSMLRYDRLKNGRIHFFSDARAGYWASAYPQEELNQLQSAFRDQDIRAADTLLSAISARIGGETTDFSFAKTVGHGVIHTLIHTLSPDDQEKNRRIQQYLFLLGRAVCKEDVQRLLDQMQQDLPRLCAGQQQDRREDRVAEGLRCMDAHYTDGSFYVGLAAEHCQMSLNNFSQQFKRRYGVSPARYLTSLRIEKAKQLLAETDLSVNEVAASSGFCDISSFQRNFKSSVSVTPSQYRAAHREAK